MKNYLKILHITSRTLMLTAVLMLAPLVCVPFFGEFDLASAYIWPALAVGMVGFALFDFSLPARDHEIDLLHSAVAVIIAWLCVMFASSLPLFLSGMSYNDALFESISGWTTTGLSVLADPDSAPKTLLLWRALTHAYGGLGLIFIMLLVMPGNQAALMMSAEGHMERPFPNVRRTIRAILLLYCGYILLGTVLYCIAGMPLFDALCHAMSAVATGGFSTRTASIGAYDSLLIESITILLMLLGAVSFGVQIMLVGRQWSAARSTELRVAPFVLIMGIGLVFVGGLSVGYGHLGTELRYSIFETVSVMTTSGFGVRTVAEHSSLTLIALLLLMTIGGMSGSTAGGIKISRLVIWAKSIRWNIQSNFIAPNTIVRHSYHGLNGRIECSGTIVRANNIIINYFLLFGVIGTLIFAANGYPLMDSLLCVWSAMTNSGWAYIAGPVGLRYLQATGMFLGRLEFGIVILAVTQVVRDLARR